MLTLTSSIALAVTAVVTLATNAGSQSSSELRVGETLAIEVSDSALVVETDQLRANYTTAPTVGRDLVLRIEERGAYTIELRSFDFDSYLVLRDGEGATLAEDDDGLIGTHSRLILPMLEPSIAYRVQVCALHGARGRCEVVVRRGVPETQSGDDRLQLELDDASQRVTALERGGEARERQLPEAMQNLASLLESAGRVAEAGPILERLLEIIEARFGPDHSETATCAYNLGLWFKRTGDYSSALPVLERAFAIREEVLGPEHPWTLGTMTSLGSVLRRLNRTQEAQDVLDRAVTICEESLGPDHPTTGQAMNSLAGLLESQGEFVRAEDLYARALEVREESFGLGDPQTLASLSNLGALYYRMGRFLEAVSVMEKALGSAVAVYGPGHPMAAKYRCDFGVVLVKAGELERGIVQLEEALAALERTLGGEHLAIANNLVHLGGALQARGDFAAARIYYERALLIREKLAGPEHTETALSLNALGLLLHAIGNYEEARPLLERALRIREAVLGPMHPFTGTSLNNLGLLYEATREYELALPLFERALSIVEQSLGMEHANRAIFLDNLSNVLWRIGRTDESLERAEEALAIQERTLGPQHPHLARVMNNVAEKRVRIGEYELAIPLLERALVVYRKTIGTDNPMAATTLNNLGTALWELGERDRGLEFLLEGLEGDRDYLRGILGTTADWEISGVITPATGRVATTVSMALRTGDEAAVRKGYEMLLFLKGIGSRVMTRGAARLFGARASRELELQESLLEVKTELSNEIYRGEVEDGAEHERRLAKLRSQRGQLERRLLVLAGLEQTLAPVSLTRIAESIPEDTRWIDFWVLPAYEPAVVSDGELVRQRGWANWHLWAWTLSADGTPVRTDLGDADEVEGAVRLYLEAVSSKDAEPELRRELGQRVHDLLWAPIAESLEGVERVIISPDGYLGSLPFEVIPLPDGRFLIEQHSFVYLQDLASMPEILKAPPTPDPSAGLGFVAVGGVDYEQRADPSAGEGSAAAPSTRGGFQRNWPDLPWTAGEVRDLHELAQTTQTADIEALLLDGGRATEEALTQSLVGKRWVHIATHGFFQPEGIDSHQESVREQSSDTGAFGEEAARITGLMPGLLTGLVCAGANLTDNEGRLDGLLTAEEVAWLDLSCCELAVLSACQTGLGTKRGGDGVVSLQRAFRLAGAKAVVSSMWSVGDESTRDLMLAFYRNMWLGGMGRLDALRSAQIDMLEESRRLRRGGRSDAWGAFVLSGDWR